MKFTVLYGKTKPVAFMNTICDVHDIAVVKRKRSDGTIVVVECLSAVVLYNDNIEGVDLADQKCKLCSASQKSKVKWCMRLFYYLLDVTSCCKCTHFRVQESQPSFHS